MSEIDPAGLTPSLQPTPIHRRPLFTPRVVIWVTAGSLAFGYLTLLAVAPELIEDLTPHTIHIADPESNEGRRAAARLASELKGLRDSVASVQLELSKVRTDVEHHGTREKALTAQLVALEKRLAQANTAAIETANPPPAPPAARKAVEPPSPVEAEAPAGANAQAEPQQEAAGTPAIPPATPRVINADTAHAVPSLESASVQKTAAAVTPKPDGAIAFGPAVVKAAAKPVGVQISSGASVDSLRVSWSILADRHADALKNLQPRYTTNGTADAPTYDLIAGPIKSKADAAKVCKALAAKNIPCKVGDFAGDAL